MCVVNGIRMSKAEFIEFQQIQKDIGYLKEQLHRPAQYGFEYKDWPVIKPAAGKRDFEVTMMDWEFRPPWVSNLEEMKLLRRGIDPKTGRQSQPIPWLNAKAENLLTSKMWAPAARSRRCLVITEGFYEWRHHFPVGKKGQLLKTAVKIPYHISIKTQKPYFFLAGIWTPWTDYSTGEVKDTFAIVTTAANSVMKMIHNSKNRMPTILPEEMAGEWIWGNLTDDDIKAIGAYQYPAEEMEYYTVSKEFLSAEDPLSPCRYAELEEQGNLFS